MDLNHSHPFLHVKNAMMSVMYTLHSAYLAHVGISVPPGDVKRHFVVTHLSVAKRHANSWQCQPNLNYILTHFH